VGKGTPASPLGHFTTRMGQKAHSRHIIMVMGCPARSRMLINLLLRNQLHTLCDSQPCSCDTATFVQRHSVR